MSRGHPSPQDPRGAPEEVVLFGSYDERRHPRVAVLRDGLSEHGVTVTEINEPLGLSTDDKIRAATSVGGALRLARSILRSWASLLRRGRRVPAPDLVVVGYLGHFDVHLARLLWRSTPIALDHLVGLADTARDRGVASGMRYGLLDLVDRMALRQADVVIVDTEEQRDTLPADAATRALVLPVGATREWFDQPPPPAPPPLRVCFVGLFTPLHGAETIGRAIAALADDRRFEFTMVGRGQDHARTVEATRGAPVRWLDWVDAEALPSLVGEQHVCLGIFGTTPKALRVVPTKVYQGLAAGNVVITSDTGPQRRALGDAATYVPPGDAEALAAALRSLADDVGTIDSSRSTRTSAASRFGPVEVVRPLLDTSGGPVRPSNLAAGPALPPNAWLRFDLLREHLEPLPQSRVLEVGPGRGAVAARLVAAGHDYTGVEMSQPSREATDELLSSISGTHRMLPSLDDLEPDERFDAVIAFEVLEHIEDDEGELARWAARVRPGGLLLMSAPACPERFSAHDLEVGHLRRYDPDELEAMARRVGLEEPQVRLYGAPLGHLLEAGRNAVAARIQRDRAVEAESALDRTKRSGAWFQPPRSANRMIQAGTWPFRVVQRRFPRRGTGLVMAARAPAQPSPAAE